MTDYGDSLRRGCNCNILQYSTADSSTDRIVYGVYGSTVLFELEVLRHHPAQESNPQGVGW